MGFGDALVGFGNALPGVASQVLNVYQAQTQLDRQKQLDQQQRDDSVLKTLETSEDPNLRSLAVIGRMRMTQPNYKPGKKGLVNDLFSVPLESHPEWQQLQQSVKMVEALQAAEPKAAAAPEVPPMLQPSGPEFGSNAPGMPGAGVPGTGEGGGVPSMPGASLSMPQGSFMTPDNPATPTMSMPAPGGAPTSAPAPGAAPAPTPNAAPAGPPRMAGAGPASGVHPELESMIRQANSGSAVSDVANAETEAKKQFGTDVLGKFGTRGEAAFKAGAQDRIGKKEALRETARVEAARKKEEGAWARQTQAAKDAMERVGARSEGAMERLLKAEELRAKRPKGSGKAPQVNMGKELIDIQRDALKDIAEVEKEVDRQLTSARIDAQKNFTNPEQVRAMEDQIKRMGEERKKTIEQNKTKSLEFLQTMGSTVPRLGGSGGGKGAAGSPRKVTRDKNGNLVLAP